jgi:hypothetical protein
MAGCSQPARTPLAECGRVPDAAAARAVLSLGTAPTRGGRRRIAFHDLGVEQLGAVYERVLEYEPVRHEPPLDAAAHLDGAEDTGSFYTPRAVTEFLVRRTLGPLVERRSAAGILALRVLDPAMEARLPGGRLRYLAERASSARGGGTWSRGGQ